MTTRTGDSVPTHHPVRVRALIADDDDGLRLLLKHWLERHGSFDVVEVAADGAEAVDAAVRVRPQLAVLDLAMPRMDGLEAAHEIRRLLPDTRIVIRSAFSASRMAQKAIDAGADAYVEKAVERGELLAVLEGLFPALDASSGGALPGVEPPFDDRGVTENRRLRKALSDADLLLPRLLDAVVTPLAVLRWRRGEQTGSSDFVVAHANRAARAETGWVVGSTISRREVSALDVDLQRVGGNVVVSWEPARSRLSRRAARAPGNRAGQSQTTELLEAAVISSPVGALLFDASARLVIANPVADRLVGGSLLLGAGPHSHDLLWADTMEPVGYEDLPVRAACQGAPFDDVELFVADRDAAVRGTYVRISGRPVLGLRGDPAGAVISVVDHTATKEAEQALAAADEELRRSNTELTNFVSTVSHDLAQPLLSISGYASLLQEHGVEAAEAQHFIDRILVGCERMRAFIDDLRSYSQATRTARPFEPVELALVVQEVVELFEQHLADTGARIEVDPLPTVVADRTQMSQLFQNLIGNALTYVASGVTAVVQVHGSRGEGEWQIAVVDNGIGIRAEDRQRAFGMFERLVTAEEYAGTGIGLAVCAKIAERHGGRIWIEGNPEGGSTISFTLPDRPPA